MNDLLPVGTPVQMTRGGTGVVIGYNGIEDNRLNDLRSDIVFCIIQNSPNTDMFYPASDYPYRVRCDNDGYEDYYSALEISPINLN